MAAVGVPLKMPAQHQLGRNFRPKDRAKAEEALGAQSCLTSHSAWGEQGARNLMELARLALSLTWPLDTQPQPQLNLASTSEQRSQESASAS